MSRLRQRARRGATCLALLVASIAGCGGAPRDGAYPRAFAQAERDETAGRFADAAVAYDHAAREAPRTRDRQHAEFLAAKATARAGDVAGATARLERIAYASPPTEHSARALYDLARLRTAHGDAARGAQDFERLVFAFHDDGLARPALRHVLAHRDATAGVPATTRWLDQARERLRGTELEETCAYALATRAEDAGDFTTAHAAYLAIAAQWPYPRGRTWDDSLYRAARIDADHGRPEEAIQHLEQMLDEREVSSMMGTYQRPRFTPALLLIASIYRDQLHDRAKARDAYHRLYSDFTTSPFRDDALWEEARLWRADGEAGKACSTLDTLVDDFPDSRYVPCAVEACPSLVRPAKSHAPRACPPYVQRGDAPADHAPPRSVWGDDPSGGGAPSGESGRASE